jgi:CheY-specific phosphatase CheX
MTSSLDPAFLNPFLNGTLEALRVTCGLEVKAGAPFLKGKVPQPDFHIAAILGITSSTFSGSITLLFPNEVFKQVVTAWLHEEIIELTKDHQDGVAELLNIIYGSAKVVWNEQGRQIQKAIPSVLTGRPVRSVSKYPVLVVPFITRFGEFHVEICAETESIHSAA